jgi:hypothetical protein
MPKPDPSVSSLAHHNLDLRSHTTSPPQLVSTPTAKSLAEVMRPTVDAALSQEPSYIFTPGAKLEAGYVRYVRILPEPITAFTWDTDSPIRCETCTQRSGPNEFPYEALSYAWGDPTPQRAIFVDGEECRIAENLWQFLHQRKRFIRHDPSCWFWIDALSIDQSDAEERRHQVGIMSTIFHNAAKVIVWLGRSYDDSNTAIHVLKSSWDKSKLPYFHPFDDRFDEMAEEATDERARTREEWVAKVPNAIASLCQRPYWKRLWVFQELRHAQDIRLMCGEYGITWAAFRNLWVVVAELRGLEDSISELLNNSLATRMMILRTKPMNFSLWNLLKETRNLDCTDERDRVYALLGVASDGHEDIEADYHASVSSLGHSILRNKYALRRPQSLESVMADCNFLRDVLRLSWTEMFGYGDSYGGVWAHKVGSPGSSFAGWAEHHRHPAVAKLLLDTI